MDPIGAFLCMLAAHFYLDYAGQGDFMAKAKNHEAPIPGVPANQVLVAHSYLHGFAVGAITGSLVLGAAEAVTHAIVDRARCRSLITFSQDQWAHIALKAFWTVLYGAFIA